MAGVFRRPLTPNTYQHLKNNFFMKTANPERFKDVFSSKRCLRCYGLNHAGTAISCTMTQLFVLFMTSLVNHALQPHLEPRVVPPTDPQVGRPEDNDKICLSVSAA